MVKLIGNVIDAKKSNAYHTVYVSGALLSQGSGWEVLTDGSGSFYTSANVHLDQLTMTASGYSQVTISIPVFATKYDGSVVMSGSLTHDVGLSNGYSYITDAVKIFIPNTMSGRVLTMQNGIDDGKVGIIVGNTVNTIKVGGASGGGGAAGWTPMNPAAITQWGSSGAICFPCGVGNLVFFADIQSLPVSEGDNGTSIVRVYNETSGRTSAILDYTSNTAIAGISVVQNGQTVAVTANYTDNDGACLLNYTISGGSWQTYRMPVYDSKLFPYTYTVSGDISGFIFAITERQNVLEPSVFVHDALSGWNPLVDASVQIPTQWDIVDAVLATQYGVQDAVTSPGRIYLYVANIKDNGAGVGTVSSAIKMYTIPSSPPYVSGTWMDVTPSQVNTNTYWSPDKSKFSHTGLGVFTNSSGYAYDAVYSKYWKGHPKWSARFGHSTVTLSGNIILSGGYDGDYYIPGIFYNDVWNSTDGGLTWTRLTGSAGWTGRWNHAMVPMADGSLIVAGGTTSGGYTDQNMWSGTYENDVWRSVDGGFTWSQIKPTNTSGWTPRYGFASFGLNDGSVVVVGGYGNMSGYVHDVWRSTNNGLAWTQQTAAASWSYRAFFTGVVTASGHLMISGGNTSGFNATNQSWVSTDKGVTWTQQPSPLWLPRYNHAMAMLSNGNIIIVGGDHGGAGRNDVWITPDEGSTWSNALPNGNLYWEARESMALTATSGLVTLTAGMPNFYGFANGDEWQTADGGVTWSAVNQNPAQVVVLKHVSGTIWTDTGLIPLTLSSSFLHEATFREVDGLMFCGTYNTSGTSIVTSSVVTGGN